MRKANKNFQEKIKWGLLFGLVLFLIAPIAHAADSIWNTPAVGDTATLNQNDSVTISMKDNAAITVNVKTKKGGSYVDFYGTAASSNSTFEKKKTLQASRFGSTFNTGNYWQRSRDCDGGGCPRVRFVNTGRRAVTLTVKGLTPK